MDSAWGTACLMQASSSQHGGPQPWECGNGCEWLTAAYGYCRKTTKWRCKGREKGKHEHRRRVDMTKQERTGIKRHRASVLQLEVRL